MNLRKGRLWIEFGHVSEHASHTEAKATRSVQEDAVNDLFPRFQFIELLPAMAVTLHLRIRWLRLPPYPASHSRWTGRIQRSPQMPDNFSRVLSRCSSITSIQWKSGFAGARAVRTIPIRSLGTAQQYSRVAPGRFRGSGSRTNTVVRPLNNMRLANALKLKSYDFHFSFGKGAMVPSN